MEKETKVAAVSMKNITKTFGSVIANDKVNLDIYKGEILSLLGENGSGKTTLMNMLSGIYFPDEGQIFINGKEEVIKSPKDALRLGIGMVHQHFMLVPSLTVTENIIMGMEPVKGIRVDLAYARQQVEEMGKKFNLYVDPDKRVEDLTVGQKQRVEILKALFRGAKILILDDSTSAVDTKTDALIRKAFREEIPDTTKIIIAQRVSSIENADQIIVLDEGKIMGVGTSEELLATNEIYREVYESQIKGGEDDE